MTRDEQEMALWREAYFASRLMARTDREAEADAAVEAFRKRYPPQPTAPPAVWYDEPPFPGEYHVEEFPRVCWVDEDVVWCPDWDRANERPLIRELPRNGRRVSPVVRPDDSQQPQAPKAIWYDEPPFLKEGATHPCWIEGYALPGAVFWGGEEWQMYVSGDRYADPLDGRRVSPITKPQEPGQ